ncbi:MAG: DNA mismatch repair protein MutS [Planctomycetaceae bacterium]
MTPAMQRYLEVKTQYPGTMLLFRIGDFYELFYDDAKQAAQALGLTLTTRDKGSTNPVPMAGFPYHQLDNYLRRLIQAGYRAAVCEQVEDAALAKGLVRREVTRVVTPGTLTDDALLDPRESNFLAAVCVEKGRAGLAWLELSTGRFVAADLAPNQLADELARLQPAECLVAEGATPSLCKRDLGSSDHKDLQSAVRNQGSEDGKSAIRDPKSAIQPETTHSSSPREANQRGGGPLITERAPWCFSAAHAHQVLLARFGTHTLAGFGWDDETSPAITAAGALLEYVQETQKSSLAHISQLEPYNPGDALLIDETTRRSLELTRTLRDGRREGSLLDCINETVTPMGARLLADWLSNPLTDVARINRRLDAVDELVGSRLLCEALRESLRQSYDLQRLTARVATGRASPRDLRCLSSTLAILPGLKAQLAQLQTSLVRELDAQLDECRDVSSQIDAAVVDEPPLALAEGGLIRPGFNAALDELRDLARGGKEWIARYQAHEIERTGIPSLKVGFNKVFGYYLEITAAQAAKTPIPADYIRKQTLKNQERFVTPELKEHEEKVLRAEQQALTLEHELFASLRTSVAGCGLRLRQSAEGLAQLDVLCGLATLAVLRIYCRPQLVDTPLLEIHDGRHAVLDRLQPAGQFVPNDTLLGDAAGRVQIITGPNMAGKSTYIRQSALLVILAQMGSFVPAKSARVGVADRIFARVGASDELGRGQSTFMVEMTETARILHGATEQSLVILDEIGRGTSTYDGISLAWAVTEFLHDVIGCRTLFATHYHELTELTQTLAHARNWNVAVREDEDQVVFLHKIVEGAADKSYGIHVARLAGIPLAVVERSQVILGTLEADHLDKNGRPTIPPRKSDRQLQLFHVIEHPVLERLREIDPHRLTPLEALQALSRMRDELDAKPRSDREGQQA